MTLEALGVLGTWTAALATTIIVGAVVGFFRYYTRRPRLGVEICLGDPGYASQITVRNQGNYPVTLRAIDWSIGQWRDRLYFGDLNLKDDEILPGHPYVLHFIGRGIYLQRLEKLSKNRDISTLRVRVHVTTRRPRRFRPGQQFLKEIQALLDCTAGKDKEDEAMDHESELISQQQLLMQIGGMVSRATEQTTFSPSPEQIAPFEALASSPLITVHDKTPMMDGTVYIVSMTRNGWQTYKRGKLAEDA